MRIVTLAALFLLSSHVTWAAGPQQFSPADVKKMQEAQAKIMAAMMTERKSRLGFNETVSALQDTAKKRGWEVGQVMDMQEAMKMAGHKGTRPFKMLSMCKKDLAQALLKTQVEHKALPFAPCRISVFEGDDGKVYIAKHNTEMMAEVATPTFAPLLKKFVEEEKALLANIAE
ncbi:MAG: DUF302 domain-containing protein [Thiobacillus sp.]